MDEAWLGIVDAGRLFRSRDLSPVQLTQRLLERIALLDGRCNAFLAVTGELALSQARQAEAELTAGTDRDPLQGIVCPQVIVDFGSAHHLPFQDLRDNVATRDRRSLLACMAGAGSPRQVARFATSEPPRIFRRRRAQSWVSALALQAVRRSPRCRLRSAAVGTDTGSSSATRPPAAVSSA
jgi:hypothetical protein